MPKGTSKKDEAHPGPLEPHRALPTKLTLEESFAAMAADLARDGARRDTFARGAAAWHAQNVGAVGRTLAVVREELAKLGPQQKN